MGTEIVAKPDTTPTTDALELGGLLARSGLLPKGLATPERATAAIIMSRELGLGAGAILRGEIYVTGAGVALCSRLMLALILRSGLVDISFSNDREKGIAQVTMSRRDVQCTYTATWDDKRVAESRANIDPKTGQEKPAWKFHRQLMKLHRAVSEAAQFTCPDLIGQVYVPDELNLPVRVENGEQFVDTTPDEPEGEPLLYTVPEEHWLRDETTRKRFWRFCGQDLGLSEDEVHEALGVSRVYEFAGTRQEAYNLLCAYAKKLQERMDAAVAATLKLDEEARDLGRGGV